MAPAHRRDRSSGLVRFVYCASRRPSSPRSSSSRRASRTRRATAWSTRGQGATPAADLWPMA